MGMEVMDVDMAITGTVLHMAMEVTDLVITVGMEAMAKGMVVIAMVFSSILNHLHSIHIRQVTNSKRILNHKPMLNHKRILNHKRTSSPNKLTLNLSQLT